MKQFRNKALKYCLNIDHIYSFMSSSFTRTIIIFAKKSCNQFNGPAQLRVECHYNTVPFNMVYPDSKVHEANVGPTRGWQDPGGPHVGPTNFAIWDYTHDCKTAAELRPEFKLTKYTPYLDLTGKPWTWWASHGVYLWVMWVKWYTFMYLPNLYKRIIFLMVIHLFHDSHHTYYLTMWDEKTVQSYFTGTLAMKWLTKYHNSKGYV